MVANGHPELSAGKCHRKYTADVPKGTGKGEMVRQERTAASVTAPAGQTPPPARPSKLATRPECERLSLPLCQRVGRLPKGRANWQQLVKINGRRPRCFAFARRPDSRRETRGQAKQNGGGYRTRLTDPLFYLVCKNCL